MRAKLLAFGLIEIEGQQYDYDVVIDRGEIRKRRKGPSKQYRDRYGHTPLSIDEEIPWRGKQLVVGTGADGALPIMAEVRDEAERRGVKIVAVPTRQACALIADLEPGAVQAVLHITC
ncbi:MAG: MTH938/NDUFAF3 family protein [Candidatus Nanopelagicales bacterium]